MATKPYMTTNDLIEAVKRKSSAPIFQTAISDADIIRFLNEEMSNSLVPSVMQVHEEYFVYYEDVPLRQDTSRYSIPSRAIGLKLRDIAFIDSNNNIFEMTRIPSEDKSYFNRNISNSTNVHKFYLENNSVVLTPEIKGTPTTGYLRMFFYMRPNQLVVDDRAAITSEFKKPITIINNGTLSPSSTVVINNTSLVPGTDFTIGGSANATASNLATAITNTVPNMTGSASGATVTISSNKHIINLSFSDTTSYSTTTTQEFVCTSAIPSNITQNSIVDILQTEPGHKIISYDITVPASGVTGSSIFLNDEDVPQDMVVGDYICSRYEAIIPMIPPDLHNGLADRVCLVIFSSLGDQQGLQMASAKITANEQNQNTMIDNRVEGSALKINGRHSLLRYLGTGSRRRL